MVSSIRGYVGAVEGMGCGVEVDGSGLSMPTPGTPYALGGGGFRRRGPSRGGCVRQSLSDGRST
jgi:hypothetical protein